MSHASIDHRHGEPTVAAPLLKQVFSVRDGRLDDQSRSLIVDSVRVGNGIGEID
uniref:Rieske-like [2Fe-2S] domain-containing protein n=1 Tax=Mycobacterium riyadhense TaxID=486698 RepID=A0A653F4L8_9MYCO|nr:hypothetical protein BIN_B_05314 [Mycobacterium riyadhense]